MPYQPCCLSCRLKVHALPAALPGLRADNGLQNTYLLVAGPQDITMSYALPAGLTCDSGCVLQWVYKVSTGCIPTGGRLCRRGWERAGGPLVVQLVAITQHYHPPVHQVPHPSATHHQTWNSCVDPCPASECGSAYSARMNPVVGNGPLDYCVSATVPNGVVPEVFKNCADIKIVAAAGTAVSACDDAVPDCISYVGPTAVAAPAAEGLMVCQFN